MTTDPSLPTPSEIQFPPPARPWPLWPLWTILALGAATIAYSNPFISNHTTQSLDSSYISDKGTAINQRIIYRRRGIKLIMLVETWLESNRRPVMDQVEQSLKF